MEKTAVVQTMDTSSQKAPPAAPGSADSFGRKAVVYYSSAVVLGTS
ncbi:hypothetical protein EDO6_00674 [Paenibacillus xylanexedens]|nr:hypothetical protein EDO6_00674 [Paenibacillus xylanexedens]